MVDNTDYEWTSAALKVADSVNKELRTRIAALKVELAATDAVVEALEPLPDALCKALDCWAGRTMSECISGGHTCLAIKAYKALKALDAGGE